MPAPALEAKQAHITPGQYLRIRITPGQYLRIRRERAGFGLLQLAPTLAALPWLTGRSHADDIANARRRIERAESDSQHLTLPQAEALAMLVPMDPEIYEQLVDLHLSGDKGRFPQPQLCPTCAVPTSSAPCTACEPAQERVTIYAAELAACSMKFSRITFPKRPRTEILAMLVAESDVPADKLDEVVDLACHAAAAAREKALEVVDSSSNPQVAMTAIGIAFSLLKYDAKDMLSALQEFAKERGSTATFSTISVEARS
jgi:hypothetical protein